MDCTIRILKVLEQLGRPIPGKITYRFYFVIFIITLIILQVIIGLRSRWQILKLRFQSIEDLTVLTFILILAIELAWSGDKLQALFDIMQQELYIKNELLTADENYIINKAKQKEIKTVSLFFYITTGFGFLNSTIPYFYGIYVTTTIDMKNITQEEIFMPIECWYPFDIDSTYLYIVTLIPQLITYSLVAVLGFCWFSTMICSIIHVEKEIDLMCLSLNKIDTLSKLNEFSDNIIFDEDKLNQYNKQLQSVFFDIIKHHQKINRCEDRF